MVQEFHVLRCFSCHTFQVQQVKKVKRWSCKLCGHKQSLLKEFGRGSGADCRHHVQKLNAARGSMLEEQEQKAWSLWEQKSEPPVNKDKAERKEVEEVGFTQVSRWTKYLNTPEKDESEEESETYVLMDRQQLHSNNSRERKRKSRGGWSNEEEGGQGMDSGGGVCWTSEQLPEGSKPQKNPAVTGATSVHKEAQPSLSKLGPSSLSRPKVSMWTRFLNNDEQVTKDEELCVSEWSPSVGGASLVTVNSVQEAGVIFCELDKGPAHNTTTQKGHKAVIKEAPSPKRTCLFLSSGSMFDTGEDFSFDDIF